MDPDVAALLDRLNAAFPALGTDVVDAVEARRIFDGLRRPPETPTPVAHVTDERWPDGAGGTLAVRRYAPRGSGGTTELTVVYLHGGGWVLGGLDSHDELVRRLAVALDATVVAVDYRRAPEHPYPAPLRDALASLDHAARSLAPGSRLVVAGDSAGANLAAAACLYARARDNRPRIAAQILLYPVLDAGCATGSFTENAEGFYITAAHLRWFWSQYLADPDAADDALAAPAAAVDLAGLPPAIVVTAALDPLRDEGNAYAARLERAGVPVHARCYEGMFHGFLAFGDRLDVARVALDETAAATRRLVGVS
ncbi:MAG TPA: alpha/beta hydrolase [Baekduia sp.]|uniref:alpha/beta hydrolase n=1 Tax=Baekduia sp. TaxID=2600305 RepID=UPI002D769DD5|nr:alpha/beta hydrolase [Baekduia sp.]HET6509077.1 alpha/beta hydrolase [Baekduia sp.]